MQTEIITTDNSIDPNAQTMPANLVIIDESIVNNHSLATESVDLPAISESSDLENLEPEPFPLSVPAADSLAAPLLDARIGMDNKSPTESAANRESIQAQLSTFFENAKSYLTAFYKTSQQLLIALGLILLAIISVKLLFAGLSTIDSIPLFTTLLKIVGLVYVVRFTWRYLIREHDRQELIETIERTKAEVLGSQN